METCQRCRLKRRRKFIASDLVPKISKRICYNCCIKTTKLKFLNKNFLLSRNPVSI